MNQEVDATSIFFMLLGVSIILRLVLGYNLKGYTTDVDTFKAWSLMAVGNFGGFYTSGNFTDYPPFYIYILAFLGKIAQITGWQNHPQSFTLLIKIPAIICDLITSWIIFKLSSKRIGFNLAIIISSLYMFNPGVFINSSNWGQVDSIFALLILCTLLFLYNNRNEEAAILFALAVMMKPQGIIFLPILGFEFLRKVFRKQMNVLRIFTSAICFIIVSIILIIPFSKGRGLLWILELYTKTTSQYPYASLNAFNLFALLGGNFEKDYEFKFLLTASTWGLIFIVLICLFTGYLYVKSRKPELIFASSAFLITGVFMLSSKMHERYLFPAILLTLISFIYTTDKRYLYIFGGISLVSFVNCQNVLDLSAVGNFFIPNNSPLLILFSTLGLLLFIYFTYVTYNIFVQGKLIPISVLSKSQKDKIHKIGMHLLNKANSPNKNLINSGLNKKYQLPILRLKLDKKDILIMLLLTLVYLPIALINLGSFKNSQTSWTPTEKGESAIYSFEGDKTLSQINWLSGVGKGEYILEYENDKGDYVKLADINPNSWTDVFKWNKVDVKVTTSKIRFSVVVPGSTLNEIGFFEKGSQKAISSIKTDQNLAPHDIGTAFNLVDESNLVPYRSSFLNSTYFDEIYHARTAFENIYRLEPYEWTHPPLGKLIISLGILIFGMCGFGWRVVGTLFGVAMIPLMYIFGKKIFNDKFLAFCTAFLMMFDFMHFAQTRIATIDVYATFFVILMFYFMYDYFVNTGYVNNYKQSLKPLFWCGLFFGIGAATKWIALYGALGLAFLLFWKKISEYRESKIVSSNPAKAPKWSLNYIRADLVPTLLWCTLFFIVIPGIIYVISYIPYNIVPGHTKGLLSEVLSYQNQMYNYHKNLKASHDFASAWWQWPIMFKPIWYYSGKEVSAGMVSTIVSFGNPAVWWIGIICTFLTGIAAFMKRDRKMLVIFAAIGAQYLPWILVPRIAFIYHFFSIVPFVIICIVYVIKILKEKYKYYIYIVIPYLFIVAMLFFVFYPALSGMEVPAWYINNLKWFKSWFF